MKDIYTLSPVNKTSAVVTSQSGCSDNFMLSNKERLKVLGQKKADLMAKIIEVKKELGIDGRNSCGTHTRYPRHILNNPLFKKFRRYQEDIKLLEVEILDVKKQIVESPEKQIKFERLFIDKVKEQYPLVFTQIKKEILNSEN